jgi:hypothetical protein
VDWAFVPVRERVPRARQRQNERVLAKTGRVPGEEEQGRGKEERSFMMAILMKFRNYSSGKTFFRRANLMVRRKSFFGGMGFSIFVSATKEIQS